MTQLQAQTQVQKGNTTSCQMDPQAMMQRPVMHIHQQRVWGRVTPWWRQRYFDSVVPGVKSRYEPVAVLAVS